MDNFVINFSEEFFLSKPVGDDLRCLCWREESLCLDDIYERLRKGHVYCFNLRDYERRQNRENFRGTHCVWLDFDGGEVDIDGFWEGVTRKPTFVYSTFGNSVYRFRALYVFEDEIVDEGVRCCIFERLRDEICADFGGVDLGLDVGTSKSLFKLIFGSNCGLDCYREFRSDCVFRLDDFGVDVGVSGSNYIFNFNNDIICSGQFDLRKCDDGDELNRILRDMLDDGLSNSDIVMRYSSRYRYLTDNRFRYGGDAVIELDDDYCEVGRRYCGYGKIVKVGKGNRDSMLFLTALKFIRIVGEDVITLGWLAYLLLREVMLYYDNSDGEMTRAFVLRKAKEAMRCRGNICLKGTGKRFVVDKSKLPAGVSAQKAIAMVKNRKKMDEVLGFYDFGLSIRENERYLSSMYDSGVLSFRPSRTWLWKMLKELGVSE